MGLDFLIDFWDSLISFEWISSIGEFFSGMFENIGEFSMIGLLFGVLAAGFVLVTKKFMLDPFLKYMPITAGVFWTILTIGVCFVGGYLMGKHFENS